MLKNEFTADQVGAVERLLVLINPSAELADQQIGQLRAMLRADEDEDDEEGEDFPNILWLLNDVIDWESGYFVDWKDTESCVHCITQLAQRWGVTVTFGTDAPLADAFLSRHDVPALIALAHAELSTHGLALWGWDTESDCYCGWITRADAAAELADISRALDIEFRPGSHTF